MRRVCHFGGLTVLQGPLGFTRFGGQIVGPYWAARLALVEILAKESLEGALVRSGNIAVRVRLGWGLLYRDCNGVS